jgi:hypothetical protein
MSITTMSGEKREDDAIRDDKDRLIGIKDDFLEAMHRAILLRYPDNVYNDCVGAEQAFEELLLPEWNRLCEEDKSYDDLPRSVHLKRWLHECKTKPIGVATSNGASQ